MTKVMSDTLSTLVSAYGYQLKADNATIWWGCGAWLSNGTVVYIHRTADNCVTVDYSTWWWDGDTNEGRRDEVVTLRPWELYSFLCERGCLHSVGQRVRY